MKERNSAVSAREDWRGKGEKLLVDRVLIREDKKIKKVLIVADKGKKLFWNRHSAENRGKLRRGNRGGTQGLSQRFPIIIMADPEWTHHIYTTVE